MMDSSVSLQLEAALLDQKIRADQHKINFETLKVQHLNIQEAHDTLKAEHAALVESYKDMHQRSHQIIQALQKERNERVLECQELKANALTAQKLENIKDQVREEVEDPFRKHTEALESELEASRSEYNKLKYNYTFLKSEYETAISGHQSMMKELQSKHKAEVAAMLKDRKELLSQREQDGPFGLLKMRQLQKENNELQQRLKSSLAEREELEAQKEHAETQNEQTRQLQSRQLAEAKALTKTLEIERSSLASQVQSLQSEISAAHDAQNTLSGELTRSQREITRYKRQIQELEHKNQMETSNLRMQHQQHCAELERHKEEAVAEQLALERQIEVLKQTFSKQADLLSDQERVVEQSLQTVKEEEWAKQVRLQNEKVELEEKLTELQRVCSVKDEEAKAVASRSEDELRVLQSQKSELESEVEFLKRQREENKEQLSCIQMELQKVNYSNKKYQALQTEHKCLQHSELELRNTVDKLQNSLRLLEEHLSVVQSELQQQEDEHKRTLQRESDLWEEEKSHLTSRIDECQLQEQALGTQLQNSTKAMKRQKKLYKKQIKSLEQSLELQNAKEEQHIAEKEALKKTLTLENHKLKKKQTELQRRHKEFLFILHHDPLGQGVGKASKDPMLASLMEQEKEHQRNLEMVNHKLDELASQL